jgi:hypothetical protein
MIDVLGYTHNMSKEMGVRDGLSPFSPDHTDEQGEERGKEQ